MIANKSILSALVPGLAVAAAFSASSASAITTTVHDLISTRDGFAHFLDSFDDGVAPPSSPNFANGTTHQYYIGASTFAVGSESGGKLTLDSALGGAGTSADGTASRTQRITVQSNSDASNTTNGLKPNHTFAASALVDIEGASGPGSIQVRLADRTSPTLVNNVVVTPSTVNEIVSIDFIDSSQTIRFRRQDFFLDTVTTISSIGIPAAADQVRMMLLHPTVNVSQVFAAAEFFDAGQSLGVYALPGSTTIFNYNGFTRVELAAGETVVAIPEPEAYAMMLVGIALVGLRLRRSTRASRVQRFV